MRGPFWGSIVRIVIYQIRQQLTELKPLHAFGALMPLLNSGNESYAMFSTKVELPAACVF